MIYKQVSNLRIAFCAVTNSMSENCQKYPKNLIHRLLHDFISIFEIDKSKRFISSDFLPECPPLTVIRGPTLLGQLHLILV
jgi:hypothetical protein